MDLYMAQFLSSVTFEPDSEGASGVANKKEGDGIQFGSSCNADLHWRENINGGFHFVGVYVFFIAIESLVISKLAWACSAGH